jgi:tyrosinase
MMASFTRRTALATLVSSTLLAFPETRLLAQTVRVRSSVASADGKRMLHKYAEAVRRMSVPQMAETSTRSWSFWWYIHATPAPKGAELNRIFGAGASPLRSLADHVWNTCQDHFPGSDPDMFLPWHRMYLLAFEAVIRSVLGDDDFAMPYWDYTAPGNRSIPAEFRSPDSPELKWLYRGNRNAGNVDINKGDPMDKGTTVSPFDLSVMRETNYSDFCSQLNGGLHSDVHVGVGNGMNMGSVPFAAGDPIFWLHHCNIDRIWAGWNPSGGQDMSSTAKFDFASPDEHGATVTFAAAQVGSAQALGYRYDKLPVLTARPVSIGTAGGPPAVIANSPIGIRLNSGVTRVPLQPAPVKGAVSSSVSSLAASGRIMLVVRDIRSDIPPGTLFEVFADLPPNAGPAQRKAHYLGTFSFFRATGEHAQMMGNRLSFDVTTAVRRLAANNQLSANPVISIVPIGKVEPFSSPTVGQLQLVRQ